MGEPQAVRIDTQSLWRLSTPLKPANLARILVRIRFIHSLLVSARAVNSARIAILGVGQHFWFHSWPDNRNFREQKRFSEQLSSSKTVWFKLQVKHWVLILSGCPILAYVFKWSTVIPLSKEQAGLISEPCVIQGLIFQVFRVNVPHVKWETSGSRCRQVLCKCP